MGIFRPEVASFSDKLLEQWNHPDLFGRMYQPGNFPISGQV
jgi:hypothetical protein